MVVKTDNISSVQQETFIDRYALRDKEGNLIEHTVEEMWERVAKAVAINDVPHRREDFLHILEDFKYVPAGRILAAMGAETNTTPYNCFVIPSPEDSRHGILKSLGEWTEIQSRGGGVGINISSLRPRGARVGGVNGTSSGPLPWAHAFTVFTKDIIQQGGCLISDTLIATADGPIKIKDLKAGTPVYSWDGKMVLRTCSEPWITKKNAEVWKLVTDKGLTVYATPDHKFLARYTGAKRKEYIELSKIKPGTPLMPLTRYQKGDEWFISLQDGSDTREAEHTWMARELNINGEEIHHKDGNHSNNVRNNLIGLSKAEHNSHHAIASYNNGTHPFLSLTEDQKKKSVEGWKNWYYSLSDEDRDTYWQKVGKAKSEWNKNRVANGTHNFVTNHPGNNEESKKLNLKNRMATSLWNLLAKGLPVDQNSWPYSVNSLYNSHRYRVTTILDEFGSWDNFQSYAEERNHRAISVEFSHYEDVYDIEVSGAHNFVVCDENRRGIVVHNSRRGAAMIMMNDDHPDLHEFIITKREPGLLEGANVSICLSDSFMEALEKDDYWYPNPQYGYFNKVISRKKGFDGIVVERVDKWKAKEIFDLIIESAWTSGEPGIYFMERANKLSNSWYFEELISTNPCAEQPLGAYAVCLLGSMNINAYVTETLGGTPSMPVVDWYAFENDVKTAVRFNDNIIDLAYYPLPETEETQKSIRRMGVGIMGLADAHIKLEIKYGSKESLKFVEEVYSHLRDAAYEGSIELAKERGFFPEFDKDKYLKGVFIKKLPADIRVGIAEHGIRNCFLLTQAPTGTTSLLAGVNSGIEPLFDRKWLRTDRIGEYEVSNSLWDSPYAVTSSELTPEQHVSIQSIAQKYNDSSISKTVNAPAGATVEDCAEAYRLAYKKGLKSIAYYRDQSREDQVLHHIEEDISSITLNGNSKRATRISLPDERKAVNHKFEVGGQKAYISVGLYDDDKPGEIFLTIGKEGSTIAGFADALATQISVGLQYGIPLEEIIGKLRLTHFEPAGITSSKTIRTATSLLDYIGHYLEKKFLDNTKADPNLISKKSNNGHGTICGECGRPAMFIEGCYKCNCGWSKC